MKSKLKYIIPLVIAIVSLIVIYIIFSNNGVDIKTYKNQDFKIEYDTTWKLKETDNGINLIHKETDSLVSIESKVLDDQYIDVSLYDLSSDILESILKQNDGFNLINYFDNENDNYESYSYLYEKDEEQVLVNLYKKDNMLIIMYYDADTVNYDIVLDSVDSILESLEIYSGEK